MPRGVRLVLLVATAAALTGSEASLGAILLIEQRDFTVQAGQEFSGNVAIFHSDHDPTVPFTITVVWGDGSSSAGSAVFVGVTPQQRYAYNVSAAHTYAQAGTYTFTVTVRDTRDNGTGSVNGTATVTAPPPPSPPPPPPPPPPQADLVLTQAHEPPRPRAGGTLTYSLTVRNRGPGTATGVRLTNDPPDGSSFVSASVAPLTARTVSGGQDACTAAPDGPLSCELGTLAPGAGAVVTHVVRLGAAAVAGNRAEVGAAQTDPAGTDNASAEEVAVAPPPPVLGRAVNVSPVRGVVLFRPRGAASFRPLDQETQIPNGSQVDTRRGRVRLQSARGGGAIDTAEFYEGVFAVFQARAPGAFTELRLAGGNFRICPPGLRKPTSAGNHPRHPVRRLWGNGRGRFRTRGRFGSATVRGTRWLTLDRCDGTLVRVQIGRMLVRDFPGNRTVQLRAGQSYLARARP